FRQAGAGCPVGLPRAGVRQNRFSWLLGVLALKAEDGLVTVQRLLPQWARAMRPDRVVPLGQHPAGVAPDPGLVLWADPLPRRVVLAIPAGTATKPRLRPRRADILQHRLVADQGLPFPVAADHAEHAVLDRVPFRRPRRVVGDYEDQPRVLRQPLQG